VNAGGEVSPGLPLAVDAGGRVTGARFLPSPHSDARPEGVAIELLIVHNISLPPFEFGGHWIEDLFLGRLDHAAHPYFDALRGLRVSAHLLVRRDGELIQFVPCAARAWHAGVSSWRGRDRCNDFSVGIELEGADTVPYTDAQYAALAAVTRALLARYPIRDIVGHSDVAPGRKTDPGPAFDWGRFRATLRSS
jgi:AmpD protein